MSEYVFGYGSLVADVDGVVSSLRGARRRWTVAMDNSVDLPGYKHYLDDEGRRPAICVAFLDIDLDGGGDVNGVCQQVSPAELEVLDRRERQYERVDVTTQMVDPPGRTWTYVGQVASRARAAAARQDGTLRVAKPYFEAVLGAFSRLGLAAEFAASTDGPGVPVVELARVDG